MEHVDFYQGRGVEAVYLGTIYAKNAGPESLKLREVFSTDDAETRPVTLAEFQARLAIVFDQAATPTSGMRVHRAELGWPHLESDSVDSPWAVCYDHGALWVHEYGHVVETIFLNAFRSASAFPRFEPHPAVTG